MHKNDGLKGNYIVRDQYTVTLWFMHLAEEEAPLSTNLGAYAVSL